MRKFVFTNPQNPDVSILLRQVEGVVTLEGDMNVKTLFEGTKDGATKVYDMERKRYQERVKAGV